MNCLRSLRSVLFRLLHRNLKPTASRVACDSSAASRQPPIHLAASALLGLAEAAGTVAAFFLAKAHLPLLVMVGGGAVTIYLSNLETVPCTNRTRFMILPHKLERWLGGLWFAVVKKAMGTKVVPPLHPDSVRVRRIASEIVCAAIDRGLADRRRHISLGRNCGKGLGPKQRALLSSLPDGWEVIVVKYDEINAASLPGGGMAVFTGLLDVFKDDAEIATVLGHEIGHIVARHTVEIATYLVVRFFLRIATFSLYKGQTLASLLRKFEIEADHIGQMVLAAAGYDPHHAPLFYEKFGKIAEDCLSSEEDYHPSDMERAQFLSQADLMEAAMELYSESRPISISVRKKLH